LRIAFSTAFQSNNGNLLSNMIVTHRRFFFNVIGVLVGLVLFVPKFLFLFPSQSVPQLTPLEVNNLAIKQSINQ
jgi:hypothetical protein